MSGSAFSILDMSKEVIKRGVAKGNICIDATCGNGYDTLFLAEIVGGNGKVFAIDIQKQAIENTKKLLLENGLDNTECILGDHSKLKSIIPEKYHGKVNCIVYNLGYLPGSDKTIMTAFETTKNSIQQSLEILDCGGIVAITLYPGHKEGKEEATEMDKYFKGLNPYLYKVFSYRLVNYDNNPPYTVIIEKVRK